MKKLKLGIIGLSEGNGHPYSWAAIFNGYDEYYMRQCPFPVIYDYLSRRVFPEDTIKEAEVTHVWTQDAVVSEQVARASNIPCVVRNYVDLIGQVDAVLLARDDAEMHYEMSKPFLAAGLPIYIDKPLATDLHTAQRILDNQQYPGQVFTCSALRFAEEFRPDPARLNNLGELKYLEAAISKDWRKYAIHIIDPVVNMVSGLGSIESINAFHCRDQTYTHVQWNRGLQAWFSTLGSINCRPVIRLYGHGETVELVFEDTFRAFRNALQCFVDIVLNKRTPEPEDNVLDMIRIIEGGLRSKQL